MVAQTSTTAPSIQEKPEPVVRDCTSLRDNAALSIEANLLIETGEGDAIVDLTTGQQRILPRSLQGGIPSLDGSALMIPGQGLFTVYSETGLAISATIPTPFHIPQQLSNGEYLIRENRALDSSGLNPALEEVWIITENGPVPTVSPFEVKAPEFFARSLPAFVSHFTYNAPFTHALYGWEDLNGHRGMRLWNIADEKVVWERVWNYSVSWSGSDWAPDGSGFVVSIPALLPDGQAQSRPELMLISVDGHESTLSRLNNSFAPGTSYAMQAVAWSPTGERVAVIVTADLLHPYTSASLYMVDLKGTQVIDLCVPVLRPALELKWSPDGNWLAFESTDGHGVTVLDVRGNSVLYLNVPTSVSQVKGWLSWVP